MHVLARGVVWTVLAALPLLAAAGPASGAPGADRLVGATDGRSTWQAVLEGGVRRERTWDNHGAGSERVTSLSRDAYRARVTLRVVVDADGTVAGTGAGRYTEATWHLEGVNGARGPFACDPVVTTPPFAARVTGRATATRIVLDVRLAAQERNDRYDCGGGYSGYAATSTFLADSWAAVGGRSLAFDPRSPTLSPLRHEDRTTSPTSTQVTTHSWRVTLRRTDAAPSPPPVEDVAPTATPPRPARTPPGIGRVPIREECTITGTEGNDVLTGTVGRDVLCGYGGDDVIGGLGGDDVLVGGSGRDVLAPGPGHDRVFGGPGDDRIGARDGERDLVNGGPGLDQAWLDAGTDAGAAVETSHR